MTERAESIKSPGKNILISWALMSLTLMPGSGIRASEARRCQPELCSQSQHNPLEWIYRMEGGKHIVLEYTGSNPCYKNCVMRLEKLKKEAGKGEDSALVTYFVDHFIAPVIGREHLIQGSFVKLSKGFTQAIRDQITPVRPGDRKQDPLELGKKAEIQLDATKYSAGALTVEVKPKSGAPVATDFLPRDHHIKRSKSPFELKQLYKLRTGKTDTLSAYRPKDFFSGNPVRIKKSLNSLFNSPQNNLRFFLNGKLTSISDLSNKAPYLSQNLITTILSRDLTHSRILQRLLKLQRADTIGIEGAMAIYSLDRKYLEEISEKQFWKENLGHGPLHWLEAPQTLESLSNKVFNTAEKARRILKELDRKQRMVLLGQYLIATAAKDCSVLLHIFPSPESKVDPVKEDPKKWMSKIFIVDIGPKGATKIPENNRKNTDLINMWAALAPDG